MATKASAALAAAAVQSLMDQPKGQGLVISCYADMSVSEGIRPRWREHLDLEVQQAKAAIAGDEPAVRALDEGVSVIRSVLSSPAARRARGVAVFVRAGRLIQTFTLDTPVENRLVVDEEMYVLPLLEVLHRQRRYLAIHSDTHHGRLYTVGRGAARLIIEISEDVPKRQRAAGERWGKQQATIARHREDHLLHYRKALVDEAARAWAEEPYAGIMLFGPHEVLEHVRKELPAHLARRVVYEGPRGWTGRRSRLDDEVHDAVLHAMREHDQRLGEEIRSRLAEHHGVVTGAQEVIDAIRNSQVNYPGFVVLEPDRGRTGWKCSGCGSLFAERHVTCPYCRSACVKGNLWQEIALLAGRHNIPVHFVAAGVGLEPHGGVVAVVTREEPWASRSTA
jgi:hypothetical protein